LIKATSSLISDSVLFSKSEISKIPMNSDPLRFSTHFPRSVAPEPHEDEALPSSLFEVDSAIRRVTEEILKLENTETRLPNSPLREKGLIYKDLPPIHVPPPIVHRAPPVATAAGFELRQEKFANLLDSARDFLESQRKLATSSFCASLAARHRQEGISAAPVVPASYTWRVPGEDPINKELDRQYCFASVAAARRS